MKIGLVERLLDAQVSRPWHVSNSLHQFACPLPVAFEIVAHHLNIDGRGQSKVQNLRDHVRGEKSKHYSGKLLRQAQAQLVDVFSGRVMVRRQGNKHVRIRSSYRRRVAVGKVDATVRQTDIVDDALDLVPGDLLTDGSFHQIAQERGVFYAHTGWPAEMQLEATGVHRREKILTQPRDYDG